MDYSSWYKQTVRVSPGTDVNIILWTFRVNFSYILDINRYDIIVNFCLFPFQDLLPSVPDDFILNNVQPTSYLCIVALVGLYLLREAVQ